MGGDHMRKLKVSWMVTSAAVLALAGGSMIVAGGDDKPAQQTPVKTDNQVAKTEAPKIEAPAPVPVKVASEPVKGASVSGTIKVKGHGKKRNKIQLDADPT